jgi:hypothetical protein
MPWYDFLAALFAGAFLANAVPHLVKGVCGDPFPTPFAKPPGKGLSSPPVNVAWALLNLFLGYLLLRAGQVAQDHPTPLLLCFAGFAALSLLGSVQFQKKHTH